MIQIAEYLKKLKQLNYFMVFIVCFIACIGFFILYSAAKNNLHPWAAKQIIRFMVGLGIFIIIAMVDIRIWMGSSYILYAGTLVLLFGVEVAGSMGMGAQRWIDLYFIMVQPSEIMKVTLLMALARYFHTLPPGEIWRMQTLIPPMIMIAVPSILVLRQPDLGTMLILCFAGLSIFFVAGIRIWKVWVSLGSVVAAMPILWHMLHDYQKSRIMTFLEPERDPLGAGYHILQSKIAIGSGGFFGKGFGSGTQSQLNFLPEKQTDFIFAMICEELGIVFGAFLLLLYGILIAYGYWISFSCKSQYGRFLGIGLTSLFFLYVFVNIGMVMGMLPVVGIPLPLVSYGGTAMLTIMMGLGLLMSTAIHRDIRVGRV